MDANQIEQIQAIEAVIRQLEERKLDPGSPLLVPENWYPVRMDQNSTSKKVELKCRNASNETTAEVELDHYGNLIECTFSQARKTITGGSFRESDETFTFSTSEPMSYDGDLIASQHSKEKIVDYLLQQASHADWTEDGLGALMAEANWSPISKKKVDHVEVRVFECHTQLGSVQMLVTQAMGPTGDYVYSAAPNGDNQILAFTAIMNAKSLTVQHSEDYGSW